MEFQASLGYRARPCLFVCFLKKVKIGSYCDSVSFFFLLFLSVFFFLNFQSDF